MGVYRGYKLPESFMSDLFDKAKELIKAENNGEDAAQVREVGAIHVCVVSTLMLLIATQI